MMTKKEYLELRILELTARKDAAEDYCMNTAMGIEATLLKAQIEVLKDEYYKTGGKILDFDIFKAAAYMG